MKKSNWLIILLLNILMYACVINKDAAVKPVIDTNPSTIYTSPKSSVAINFSTQDKYKSSKSISVYQQAQHGEATFRKEGLLVYSPDSTQNVKSDFFLLKVLFDSTKQAPRIDTITIKFTTKDSIPCLNGVVSDIYSTKVNALIKMNVLANDRVCNGNLDSASLKIEVNPIHGNISISNNRITFIPVVDYSGYDNFIYQVCDSKGVCYLAPVKIYINSSDSSSFCKGIKQDNFEIYVNQYLNYQFNVLINDNFCKGDIDSSSLKIETTSLHGKSEIINNRIVYTPVTDYIGTDVIIYNVCSKSGSECGKGTVKININQGCNVQIKNDDFKIVVNGNSDTLYTKGTRLNVTMNDEYCNIKFSPNDVNIVKQQPLNGNAYFINDLLFYQPNAGFKGSDVIIYGLCNSIDNTCIGQATVSIKIE